MRPDGTTRGALADRWATPPAVEPRGGGAPAKGPGRYVEVGALSTSAPGPRLYSVFGGVLASDVPLPGVRPAAAAPPDWRLRLQRPGTGPEWGDAVGVEHPTSALTLTLHHAADGGYVLRYHGLGIGDFHLSADGSEITWSPGPNPPLAHLRWIVLGRVMALAHYLAGTVCLHASCVAMAGAAICLLAAKRHGKSTLAAALVAAGARLGSDDVVPVEVGPRARVRPGVHGLRLREPDACGLGPYVGPGPGGRGKTAVDRLPENALMHDPHPLVAVYVLAPGAHEPAPGRAAAARRMEPIPAFEALVRHASLTPLLPVGESRTLLDRAAALARTVPIYELRVVRDLTRLPEVVAELQLHHAARGFEEVRT